MTVRIGMRPAGMGRGICKKPLKVLGIWALALALTAVTAANSQALQKHSLTEERSAGSEPPATAGLSHGPLVLQPGAGLSGHEEAPFASPAPPAPSHSAPAAAPEPKHSSAPAAAPAEPSAAPAPSSPEPAKAPAEHAALPSPAAGGHETPGLDHGTEAPHEGHGVVLPTISPIAGVTFVETAIALMEHELHGRFLGWRPNDLVIGRFTDNINYFQLGVLEAIRFTTLRLKDSLTRMGEADTYDRDLEDALNLFMNKATLFWFPSAESSYSEAVDHLRAFLAKLKSGRRSFYYRTDNLQALISSYGDLLGNVNKSLAVQTKADGTLISWFESDDYFYYAKGVAHVLYEILKVVRVGYKDQLVVLDGVDIMDEILHELHTAETMDPWIVLNSDLDGFFANHRANLNAPLSEVAHLMGILSRF